MSSRKVLELLRKIPRGEVTTYGALAKAAHTSPRAVGAIMRRNKDPIRYPCYKVVHADGRLGGYCGKTSGPAIKRKMALVKKDGIAVENGKIDLEKHLYKF
jgi:O-6-methylguanine DNA methyltransferase